MLRRLSMPYVPSKKVDTGGQKESNSLAQSSSCASCITATGAREISGNNGLPQKPPKRSIPRQNSMTPSIPGFRRSISSRSDSESNHPEEINSNNTELLDSDGRVIQMTANERRKLQRERHQRAVVDDLVDMVCDIYAAESKVLNRFSASGCDPISELATRAGATQHNSTAGLSSSNPSLDSKAYSDSLVKYAVRQFIQSFPPSYALGIDSPGEVLLHMRQLSTPKSNPSKAAVHVVHRSDYHSDWPAFYPCQCYHDAETTEENNKRNVCLVTIAFAETAGMLDYIASFLESGGSQIINADFMLSTENIVLSRFVVDMKGRLRIEKLQEYIEVYLGHVYGHPDINAPSVPITVRFGCIDPSKTSLHTNEQATFHPAHKQSFGDDNTTAQSTQGMTPTPLPKILGYEKGELDVKEVEKENVSEEKDGLQAMEQQQQQKSSDDSDDSRPKQRSLLQRRESIDFELPGYSTLPPPGSSLKSLDNLMVTNVLRGGREVNVYRGYFVYTDPLNGEDQIDSAPFALKVATDATGSNKEVLDELRGEIKMASDLDHPNIYTSRTYDYLPLILDIVKGMCYLHSRNIIHRDLKPGNIFLDNNCRAKISDFGMSVPHTGEDLTGETGTYRWMAPEVIRHEPYSRNADVYSFGILLWQLVTRSIRPFADMSPIQTAFAVAKGQRPHIPDGVPCHISQIITACWDEEQLRRPSFSFISMALADYASAAYHLSANFEMNIP